jgi:energy-coupling factor transport system substrate-specific component
VTAVAPHARAAAVTVRPAGARQGVRTAVVLALASVVGVMAFCWPLLARPGAVLSQDATTPVVLGAVLVVALVVAAVALDDGRLDAKAVAVLGLLAAVGSVLRPLSAGTAGVELVFLTIVLGGRVFGPAFGFALGSTTLVASALLTGGVGPWLPYQMLGASWVGLGAGLLPGRVRGRGEVAMLAGYGAAAALVYGVAMNFSFWPFSLGAGTGLSFVAGDGVGANLHRFWLYSLATSLGWDVGRAVTTAVGLALLGGPALRALRRTAARARFAPAPAADRVGAAREDASHGAPGHDTPGAPTR